MPSQNREATISHTVSVFIYSSRINKKQIYNLTSSHHITRCSAVAAKNGKILSKSLFWNEWAQREDSRWTQESTFISFSIIYYQIGITFQLNYYQ